MEALVVDEECPICVKTYSSTCCKVVCSKCSYATCKSCCQNYIKSRMIEPVCMNCQHVFGDMWLVKNCSKSFVLKEVKAIRKEAVWQREQGLLPQTQDYARELLLRNESIKENEQYNIESNSLEIRKKIVSQQYTQIEKLIQKLEEYIRLKEKNEKRTIKQSKELEKLRYEIACLCTVIFGSSYTVGTIDDTRFPTVKELNEKKEAMNKELGELRALVQTIEINHNDWLRKRNERERKQEKQKTQLGYVLNCPANECRGFMRPMKEKQRLICDMCLTEACNRCHKLCKSTEKHGECNKDDLATVRSLKENTRSCPSCHAPIFKIDGCDFMFCTSCNTPFSWTTGKILSMQGHNPHLAEYRARVGLDISTAQTVPNRQENQMFGCDIDANYNILQRWIIRKSSTGSKNQFLHSVCDVGTILRCRNINFALLSAIGEQRVQNKLIENRANYR
jgi:hypothetical protein